MLDIITVVKDNETYCITSAGFSFIAHNSDFLKYWIELRNFLDENSIQYEETDYLNLYFPSEKNCIVYASGYMGDKEIKVEVRNENGDCRSITTKYVSTTNPPELVAYIAKLITEESNRRVQKIIDALSNMGKFVPNRYADRCCCDDKTHRSEMIDVKNDIRFLKDGFERLAAAVSELDHEKDKLNDQVSKLEKKTCDIDSTLFANVLSFSKTKTDLNERVTKLERVTYDPSK